MRISRRVFRLLLLLAALLPTACGFSNRPAPQVVPVKVGGVDLVIAAADGLCVDPANLKINRSGVFAFLDDCAALGPVPEGRVRPATTGLITVAVAPGAIALGDETAQEGLTSLRAFLTGPGLPALGRIGPTSDLKVEQSAIEGGLLLLQLRDPADPPWPGLSQQFWRGFVEVRGQTVSASVSKFRGRKSLSDGRAQLKSVLNTIVAANPELPVAAPDQEDPVPPPAEQTE